MKKCLISSILILSATLATAAAEDTVLRDINGVLHGTIERMTHGKWTILFFLMTDCPIANRYAPEIQRICSTYESKGAQCFLIFVDPSTTPGALRQYVKEYNYAFPAILDSNHKLVKKAAATVSSEVAVFSNTGDLKYRGRIDNFNADIGSTRQRATQHDLRDALDALIAGRNVPSARTQAIGCFIPE